MTTIESRRQFTDSSPGTAEATQQSTPPSTRPEDERLGLGRTFGYGVQHILAMFGGVIAVPLIVGGAAGLDTTDRALLVACGLFISGLATLLQTLGIPFLKIDETGLTTAGTAALTLKMGHKRKSRVPRTPLTVWPVERAEILYHFPNCCSTKSPTTGSL